MTAANDKVTFAAAIARIRWVVTGATVGTTTCTVAALNADGSTGVVLFNSIAASTTWEDESDFAKIPPLPNGFIVSVLGAGTVYVELR